MELDYLKKKEINDLLDQLCSIQFQLVECGDKIDQIVSKLEKELEGIEGVEG